MNSDSIMYPFQSLHGFQNIESLLLFRENHCYGRDSYIYFNGAIQGLFINGVYINPKPETLLLALNGIAIECVCDQYFRCYLLLCLPGGPSPKGFEPLEGGSLLLQHPLPYTQGVCIEALGNNEVRCYSATERKYLIPVLLLLFFEVGADPGNLGPYGRRQQLAYRFVRLVSNNAFREHRTRYYADRLFITEGYLAKCVQSTLNQSPKKYITSFLIRQAIYILETTNITINELSWRMGFESSGAFTIFFRYHTGKSPSGFRA